MLKITFKTICEKIPLNLNIQNYEKSRFFTRQWSYQRHYAAVRYAKRNRRKVRSFAVKSVTGLQSVARLQTE